MKKLILCLLFISCGQASMSSDELEVFFKGQKTLFVDDPHCDYKMTRVENKIQMGRYYYSDFHLETFDMDGIPCGSIMVSYVKLISCENNSFIAYTRNHSCRFFLK